MKYINVTFTNREMARLKKVKGTLSWRSFILRLLMLAEDCVKAD